MKDIKYYILEAYDKKIVIPAFEYNVITKSLEAYKDNDERKKNEGNGRPSKDQLDKVIEYLEDKKNFKYVGKLYEKEYRIPPFEYYTILQALEAYVDNDDRKNNQGNGRPTDEQMKNVIKWFKK